MRVRILLDISRTLFGLGNIMILWIKAGLILISADLTEGLFGISAELV
jgi:hypothetical protein